MTESATRPEPHAASSMRTVLPGSAQPPALPSRSSRCVPVWDWSASRRSCRSMCRRAFATPVQNCRHLQKNRWAMFQIQGIPLDSRLVEQVGDDAPLLNQRISLCFLQVEIGDGTHRQGNKCRPDKRLDREPGRKPAADRPARFKTQRRQGLWVRSAEKPFSSHFWTRPYAIVSLMGW